jgi:hypothetical protein
MTQFVMNISPSLLKSSPQGFVVPQAYGSKTCRVGW